MSQWIYKMGARISVLPIVFAPKMALAVGETGLKGAKTQLGEIGTELGGDTPDSLTELIGGLINALFGVMGIVFVVLTVYAGYLYMTAQGDKENTEKAKKLLGQAVIGLVIIVAAYAIAQFVIDTLTTAVS